MAFKNHDIPASEVDISEAAEEIMTNFDNYCGFTKEKQNQKRGLRLFKKNKKKY
jgi:hypothetical protein